MASATGLIEAQGGGGFIPGRGAAMQSLERLIADVARTRIPLLIMGESGTGKDVYSRLIHRRSECGQEPFTKLSCALVNLDDFLPQLKQFCASKPGMAGTLFVDGVDELDLSCQRALLSLIPDTDATVSEYKIQARLICSCSQDLDQEIAAGRFRRELYFRINGVCLRLPPLRERKEDIRELFEFLLRKHSDSLRTNPPVITEEILGVLRAYPWPGNIRELGNVARKMLVLGDPAAAIADLQVRTGGVNSDAQQASLSSFKLAARAASRRTERELILKALKQTNWNRKRAAQELKISYKSLLYKMKQITDQNSQREMNEEDQ